MPDHGKVVRAIGLRSQTTEHLVDGYLALVDAIRVLERLLPPHELAQLAIAKAVADDLRPYSDDEPHTGALFSALAPVIAAIAPCAQALPKDQRAALAALILRGGKGSR